MTYADMKDSGVDWIGDIPTHWTLSKMASLYALRNEKVSDKEYPPLSVTMNGIVPQLETVAKTEDRDNRKLVKAGDFAINSRSDRRGSCGISAYDGSVSLINIVLIPRNRMNPEYYNWLFHSELFADEFYKCGHGIVDDLWTTRWQEMKQIYIPVPALQEQEQIARFLNVKCSKIDAIIDEAKDSIEEYKRWKASMIYQAVTKGLDPDTPMKDSGIPWIEQIPLHWKETKISRAFATIGSGTTPVSSEPAYYDGGIPWLQSGDIGESEVFTTSKSVSRIALDDISALKIYKAPFIAVAMYGASIANTSVVCIDACTNQACCVLSQPKENIYFKFVYYAVLASKEELLLSARGGTQPNISQDIIKKLKIPLPPLEEQKQIANFLETKISKIYSVISEKQSIISELEAYKKSLIYEAVTGKRKVG